MIRKPEDFEWYKLAVGTGEITVTKACEELGISCSTWYKWVKRRKRSNEVYSKMPEMRENIRA